MRKFLDPWPTKVYLGFIVVVAVLCVAAQAPAAAASTFNWMDILKGLASGAIAAAIGYFKAQSLEKPEVAKLAKTVIFGGIVGAVAAWRGSTIPEAEKWTAMVGLSFVLTFLWDIIMRRVATPGIAKMMARARDLQPPPK